MRLEDPVSLRAWRAELALEYELRGARTVLARRRHEGPLVVQKPLYPEGDAVCHTILVHPPGGIAGGDELSIVADARPGARVLLTTPAAGKWYRSAGPWARQRVTLNAGAAACVEWLPQETIIYDGARAHIETDVRLADGASFIGWDVICLGRTASGERYTRGATRLRMRVRRGEKTIWLEQGTIAGGARICASAAGLRGCPVFGTLIATTLESRRALLDACRGERAEEGETAMTSPPGLIVARYLGNSSEAARHYFQRLWHCLRAELIGRPAVAPRIWST
ncbi:MAG TPA: urease accessory protein UreD [Burkholderiales bacterium]|nr:urease accessory protein UreD [Burkholderiales bacterium]